MIGRDSVLRQFAAANRARFVMHRFAPVDTADVIVALLSDTSAAVAGTYEREFTAQTSRWNDRLLITHEFRRRPAGWCATHGRTVALRPAAPVAKPGP